MFRMGLSVTALVVCVTATALHAEEGISRRHQYPDATTVHFTTWSIFLVCDPTWLQAEGKTELTVLYNSRLASRSGRPHLEQTVLRVTPP
jgi:hypothetical protein